MPLPLKPGLVVPLTMMLGACLQPGVVRPLSFPAASIDATARQATLGPPDFVLARSRGLPRRLAPLVTGNGHWGADEVYVTLRPSILAPAAWTAATASTLAAIGVAPGRIRQSQPAGAGFGMHVQVHRYAVRRAAACAPLVQPQDEQPTLADASLAGLGCANEANLRAMVAYPRDLRGNAARPMIDGDRAAGPVQRAIAASQGGGPQPDPALE